MLKIRLQRVGKKNDPSFRLVLTDSQNATRSGKFLEILGSHDFRKTGTIINKERSLYWISQGVQLTDTVHNLFLSNKIIEGKKINVLPKKTVPKKEEVKEEPKVEAPKAEVKAEEPKVEATPAPEPEPTPVVEAPAETPVEAPAEPQA